MGVEAAMLQPRRNLCIRATAALWNPRNRTASVLRGACVLQMPCLGMPRLMVCVLSCVEHASLRAALF
eukprot:13005952-Alexandrium_andersonii.AAC.1